ncbi:protein FAR1-RELATED SEQUENCE 5-like [Macadamia integrifolia]|uniref:protein FAR1-RELATED SEQUENCE 5-like n=1 Tax=Macadamia integrifolia TaxID=60698 RepID=UPI001C4E37C1|nr:protein FAR1-RELATED SEQUENCE 5-like [Macadamia integrifolia]
MRIKLNIDGMYNCIEFVEEHNHELHLPSTSHMMKSQRSVSEFHAFEIDLEDDSGIRPKDMFEYMSRHAAGSLLLYFENQIRINPSFTYSLQLDNDEQITNIFFADPKMRIDYAQFGDVSFDTIFSTNKESRPFGIFAGFNHHRGIIIFGAAVLYDETTDSFKWLFEVFLEAHGQKKPITIFTD